MRKLIALSVALSASTVSLSIPSHAAECDKVTVAVRIAECWKGNNRKQEWVDSIAEGVKNRNWTKLNEDAYSCIGSSDFSRIHCNRNHVFDAATHVVNCYRPVPGGERIADNTRGNWGEATGDCKPL